MEQLEHLELSSAELTTFRALLVWFGIDATMGLVFRAAHKIALVSKGEAKILFKETPRVSNFAAQLLVIFEGKNEEDTLDLLDVMKQVVDLDEGESEEPLVATLSEDTVNDLTRSNGFEGILHLAARWNYDLR